jgi:hypothetical protein
MLPNAAFVLVTLCAGVAPPVGGYRPVVLELVSKSDVELVRWEMQQLSIHFDLPANGPRTSLKVAAVSKRMDASLRQVGFEPAVGFVMYLLVGAAHDMRPGNCQVEVTSRPEGGGPSDSLFR